MRIAVVGGGIVGISVAHALLDEGHAVDVFDPDDASKSAARGNAGWIAHLDIMPLASKKAWAYMPRWLMDPLGPLAIAPSYLPALAPWLARFVAASRPSRIAAGSQAIRAINAASMAAWERRLAALGLGGELRRRGILSVWIDSADFAASAGVHARQAALGIPVERLDTRGVQRLEPAFGSEVVGGTFFETGAHVADPGVLLEKLREAARLRQARLIPEAVSGIGKTADGVTLHRLNGEPVAYDRVVIAAGAWSKDLARMCGDRVPLDTERGYNISTPAGTLGITRPIMLEGLGIALSPLDTGDRIGGSVEFAGLDAAPNWARVDAILGRMKRVLPNAKIGEGRRWMGFRPSLPDSLPVIGAASGDPRVFYAFGHAHHGLTQATATAEMVAALVAGRRPSFDPEPYSPRRF
ncbi:MAG: FAD-binding oxidoreductase [Proteobacteria bacterium]|nr:FAD-binding oxidoreductase [Pseudomonadota bacterium]